MSAELAAAVAAFAARGGHPVRDLLGHGPAPFVEWDHYPEGDAGDPDTGYSWYYHAHPQTDPLLAGSHGHFHLYAAPRLFAGVAPIDAPAPVGEADPDAICLLVSIAVSPRGRPQALFALNRIGAGQWIFPAPATHAVLERFTLGPSTPCPDVARWLGAFVRSRRSEIAELLADRDRALAGTRDPASDGGRCAEVLLSRSLTIKE